MKPLLTTIAILLFSNILFSQNLTATTSEGKKVILKNDKTWEYINEQVTKKSCVVEPNFKEPKGNNSAMWKKVGTTIADMKKHVSVDLEVSEKDITLLELSEQFGNAIYVICINGEKLKYRRTGSVFFKDGAEPYSPK